MILWYSVQNCKTVNNWNGCYGRTRFHEIYKSWLSLFVVFLLIKDFEYVFTEHTSLNIVNVISRNLTTLKYRMMIFACFTNLNYPLPSLKTRVCFEFKYQSWFYFLLRIGCYKGNYHAHISARGHDCVRMLSLCCPRGQAKIFSKGFVFRKYSSYRHWTIGQKISNHIQCALYISLSFFFEDLKKDTP